MAQGPHVPDLGESGLQKSGGGQRNMDGNTGRLEICFCGSNPDPSLSTESDKSKFMLS